MKTVGLTGGIGSGKSTIAKMFQELGVSVYIADDRAKYLMSTDATVKKQIVALLGEEAYVEEVLNRPFIASKVFNNTSLLHQLNSIVHPAVGRDFIDWKDKQLGSYVVKEAAILFENDGYKQCDVTILVTAPLETRIDRVLQRDDITREAILNRIANQWPDEEKIPLADFVIENIDLQNTKDLVQSIHSSLKK